MSSTPKSFWRGGDFIGDARSGEFVDAAHPAAMIKVMNVETPEQATRVVTEYRNEIIQFWVACDAQHYLARGDHRSFRKRVREIELVYVTQAGQPYIEVWPDPVDLEEPELVTTTIFEVGERPLPPIYVERPRSGLVHREACYETVINEDTFTNYPPSLWFTRDPPISPAGAGDRDDILPRIAAIQAAYAALSPEDAERYQLSRIISAEWVDEFGNDKAGYVTLCRLYERDSKLWKARPEIEFPAMGLLPVEPDPDDPNPDQELAPPQTPEDAQAELENEPIDYFGWPNGTEASLHDFFGPGAPLFQQTIVDQFGQVKVLPLGFGNIFNTDPQGLPDTPLTTCGITYSEEELHDEYGHPYESQQDGSNPNRYWPFAPLTFWRPDGTEIVGPYPLGGDGFVPQEPPFGPMSTVDPDFFEWLSRM